MNKVSERCAKDSCAKFTFASQRLFKELKYVKIFLYLLNVVPVVICFLKSSDEFAKLICSCVSFGLTLFNEVTTGLLSSFKEKAIMMHQLYEAGITGTSFSKIEYDRESTNDLSELAIRKGLPKMKKVNKYPVSKVPQEISDDYSYLYLCRTSAARTRYLLSRQFYGYVVALVAIAVGFLGVSLFRFIYNQAQIWTPYLIICSWPLIIPLVRNCTYIKKCMRYCVKLCADIDNFFADGDDSIERLARFIYYVQNIEFEMMLARPIIFRFWQSVCNRGVTILMDGVTTRFKEAILELKNRNLIYKGVISKPHGKGLIIQRDYNWEDLEKAQLQAKKKKAAAKESSAASKATSTKKTAASSSKQTTATKASTSSKPAAKKTTATSTKTKNSSGKTTSKK